MMRELTQDELRNRSDDVIRALEEGESFIVTRDGIPIGELKPLQRRTFVSVDEVTRIFSDAPRIDYDQFRRDLDEYIDQDPWRVV